MSAGIMITGTENIRTATILTVAHGLAFEIKTGMQMSSRGSMLKAAKIQGIVPATSRSKKAALKECVKLLKERQPDYTPSKTITEVLEAKK